VRCIIERQIIALCDVVKGVETDDGDQCDAARWLAHAQYIAYLEIGLPRTQRKHGYKPSLLTLGHLKCLDERHWK